MSRGLFLVLCTHNSRRSQMAEAFLRSRLGERMSVASAGTEPGDAVDPLTVEVMAEKGLDLRDHRPSHYREFLGKAAVHTVAIVCDRAGATCPTTWPGALRRIESPFDDPAAVRGSREERLAAFRAVRDAIDARTAEWVAELEGLGVVG
jgi:arsenate reductase